ncbi:HD domain-containing protein [Methylophaga nitratireducenticrescens]|uniref:HD domain-containing protein n=1 Tax=Methylophaga nitratireducenticrescens TaxID=754476 RepID=UPI000CDCA230|nr:HD domain-containing protein [Methylophaga nitratireducenticrescens]AUZ83674.1 guanosine-3',5'-bis(diphosphate) 3'-pyrophosphohydrolase [Methylophaga nitratireducenticrescens]
MITITRTEFAFATIDASIHEWNTIKTIVRYCANNYRNTELLYCIPGPEEQRLEKLQSLSEIMDHVWGPPPLEDIYRDQLFLITHCIKETEGKDLPNVDDELHANLVNQVYNLGVYDIFDDDNVSDEQWASWQIERSIHNTKTWIIKLHAKQTDKAGKPYVQHPLRVHMRLQKLFPDAAEDVRHAALLHDVMEDCGITSQDLRERGYSESTIQIVDAVTKRPDDGLSYKQRIEQLALTGPLGAIQVKLCDLLDNTDPERLKAPPREKTKSLSKRYSIAIEILQSRLASSD